MTTSFLFFQASVAGLAGASLDLNRLTAALPTRPTGADVLTGDSLFHIAAPSLPDATPPLSVASFFRKPQEVLFAEATEGALVTAGSDSKIDQPAGFGLSPSSLRIHADNGYWEVDLPSELADELRAFLPGNDGELFYTSPDSLHITLVGPQDLARLVALEQEKDPGLSKSKAQKIVKDKVKALTVPQGNPRITGIGSAVDPSGSHTVYFATVEWPEVQEWRKELGLKEKDLHATLASTASETDPQTGLPTGKPKDVHYADANKTPISKSEPNVVRHPASPLRRLQERLESSIRRIDEELGSADAESVDDVEMLDMERESLDRERRFAELILDLQAAEPQKFESVLDLFRRRRMGLGANAALDPSDEIALVKFLFFESPPVFPTREGTEDVMESEGQAGQMDLESEIEAILNKSVESSQRLMERILLPSLQPPEGPSPDHPTLMEPEDAVRSELLVGLQEFAGKLATNPSLVGLVASLNAQQQKFLRDVLRILRGADASGH